MNVGRVRTLRAAATAALAATLALGLFVVPAWGENVQSESPPLASVAVQSPGILVAKGVAVDVEVEYMCLPGVTLGGIFAEGRQRFGRNTALGSGFAPGSDLVCDGMSHLATIRLRTFETPFKPGTALVLAEAFGFDGSGFFSIIDEAEVRFQKNKKK